MMGGMEKTTVYLTATQKAALARAAAAQGRSEARLIRAGIDVVTAGHRAGEAVAAFERAPEDHVDGPVTSVGAPAAGGRPRWIGREEFVRTILRHQADVALRQELRELAPDTTDKAGLP